MSSSCVLYGSSSEAWRVTKVLTTAALEGVDVKLAAPGTKLPCAASDAALAGNGVVLVHKCTQGEGQFVGGCGAAAKYVSLSGSATLYPRKVDVASVIDAHLDRLLVSVEPALIACADGVAEAAAAVDAELQRIEAYLGTSTYLCGETISLADICYAAALSVFAGDKCDAYASLSRWMKTMRAVLVTSSSSNGGSHDVDAGLARLSINGNMEEIEWPAKRVRQTFVDFFKSKGHTPVSSSPVVPHDDPTLLFTNAGMNQFKPIFLGTVDPNSPLASLSRACNSQKCTRAGGKHNDLQDVGKDTYHHTFFEMLGNWSFGDYFKEGAIAFAWELLTEVFKLPQAQLYATYFGGDPKQGLAPDDDARKIWLKYLPEDRVLPFDCKDNFWEMGDTGPCGPCTEIHFDRLGGRFVPELVNADDPTLIEIWNVVFIQFNREHDGSLKTLPAQHVDTGMGFERIASILQNKMSNYDTDIFVPIFEAIKAVSGARPYAGKLGAEDVGSIDMAYRVVADHIRTLSFAIADGARPGNEGREYVLRRILRRAVRYGQQNLNAPQGFFAKLVAPFVALMSEAYPELETHRATITEVIADEERVFGRTLQRGIERFSKAVKATKGTQISGEDAFLLWDTFGFPFDLTELMAEERGFSVDEDGFNRAMENAKNIARAARKTGSAVELKMEAEQTSYLQRNGVLPTIDASKFGDADVETVVCAILTRDGFVENTASLTAGDAIGIVLRDTSFYAEQGGQTFDTGALRTAACSLTVTDTRVAAGFVLHVSSVPAAGGPVAVGDAITSCVDYVRRRMITPNHTFTHVVNLALRQVLGDGINQKGSLNDADKLRFDFSYNKAMSIEQMERTEQIAREQLEAKLEVYTEEVALDKALTINGVRAVFGEVYPDPVRVVSVGVPVSTLLADPSRDEWLGYSVEFCGGTHVKNTSDAGAFALMSEEAVGKGVRRVVGVTGKLAADAIVEGERVMERLQAAAAMSDMDLSACLSEIKSSLETVVISSVVRGRAREHITALTKRVAELAKKQASANKERCVRRATELVAAASAAGKTAVVFDAQVGMDNAAVREAVTAANKKQADVAIMVVSADDEKDRVAAFAGVPADLQATIDCTAWVRATLAPIQGKGGGKKGTAQGQGVGASKLSECIREACVFAGVDAASE